MNFGKNYFSKTIRISGNPCLTYFKSVHIKNNKYSPLLANLTLYKQILTLLSNCFNAVTYFLFIFFNISIFCFNEDKEGSSNLYLCVTI